MQRTDAYRRSVLAQKTQHCVSLTLVSVLGSDGNYCCLFREL
jgi:hypothetical protein